MNSQPLQRGPHAACLHTRHSLLRDLVHGANSPLAAPTAASLAYDRCLELLQMTLGSGAAAHAALGLNDLRRAHGQPPNSKTPKPKIQTQNPDTHTPSSNQQVGREYTAAGSICATTMRPVGGVQLLHVRQPPTHQMHFLQLRPQPSHRNPARASPQHTVT